MIWIFGLHWWSNSGEQALAVDPIGVWRRRELGASVPAKSTLSSDPGVAQYTYITITNTYTYICRTAGALRCKPSDTCITVLVLQLAEYDYYCQRAVTSHGSEISELKKERFTPTFMTVSSHRLFVNSDHMMGRSYKGSPWASPE